MVDSKKEPTNSIKTQKSDIWELPELPAEGSVENIEIELLVQGLFHVYGYDFREYSRSTIYRRTLYCLEREKIGTVSELLAQVLRNQGLADRLREDYCIHTTELFRDPWFFKDFREVVLPHLRTYPAVNIWHAGCSSGHEVYSMAIFLSEEGLLSRCRLYGTDISDQVITQAATGVCQTDDVQASVNQYNEAGGKNSLNDYIKSKYGKSIINKELRNNLLFSTHNLVTDGVFIEAQVILCRNVMIYFNNKLKMKVLKLFFDSLCYRGYLCLGSSEALLPEMAKVAGFERVQGSIFQKKR